MTVNPKIFISYSRKSPLPADVERMIGEMKDAIKRKGWLALDPMTEPGVDSISDKVKQDLLKADAIFAEITMGVPNVLFEVGFGRALGCTIVTFVNSSALDGRNGDWNLYLELIKQDKKRPLPADLGDLEYFQYSSDVIHLPNERDALRKRIDGLLARLGETTIAQGACLLRSNYKRLLTLTQEWLTAYYHDHPILRHIGGWYGQLADEFGRERTSAFEIDSNYYEACLSAFYGYQGKANAIADLTGDTENFWEDNPDPLQKPVTERLFLIGWKTFFDKPRVNKIAKMLANHKKRYAVRVGVIPPIGHSRPHHFGRHGVGHHLLLMEPDLVGGYVLRDDRERLRIESNSQLYQTASEQYRRKREQTIDFYPNWTWRDLRKHWLMKERIGQWNSGWGPVVERDEEYFNNYDMHIRCWIPSYDDLISDCLARVQSNIIELLQEGAKGIKILEIGYGTGALTQPLLEWINNLNHPFSTLRRSPPVDQFVGIDTAKQMNAILNERLREQYRAFSRFEVGTAWHDFDLPVVTLSQPYDVICGSLVLHDILDGPEGVSDLFESCSQIMKPGGRAVFADSFSSDDAKKHEYQVKEWINWMTENGLEKKDVDQFIDKNREMTDMPSEEKLKTSAQQYGFSIALHHKYLPRGRRTPFGVLTMKKDKNA